MRNLLASDPLFNKNLQEKLLSKNIPENGICLAPQSDILLKVRNPHEFIIGRNILPSEAHLGKKDVSVIFRGITAAEKPVSKINREIIWYRFGVISGEAEYPLYYSADVKSREKKYLQLFNSLLVSLLKKLPFI